jgi:hypothetical protein
MSTAVFHRPEHGREAGHLDDFSEYGIVDRLGTTLELIPHLFGASNRHPADQRGPVRVQPRRTRRART